MDSIVSAGWLQGELGAADLRIVDSSFFLPDHHRDAAAEFRAGHIPGAVFLDLDRVSDPQSPLPHSLPSAEAFAAAVEALGIGRDSRIVVYDNSPLRSAARGWWMFRLYGAANVAVLDGGLAAWTAAGGQLASGEAPAAPHSSAPHFPARRNDSALYWRDDMLRNIRQHERQAVDARSAGRFSGVDPEPRPGMRSGHVPGASNLPFATLYTADGHLKDRAGLAAAFAAAGVDWQKPLVASCGSGVTACCVLLAANVLGAKDLALYDGSWAEWGSRQDTPVATGA